MNEEIQLSILEDEKQNFLSIKEKIIHKVELSYKEKLFIIDNVLSNRMSFDLDGNPTKDTICIENLIDLFNS